MLRQILKAGLITALLGYKAHAVVELKDSNFSSVLQEYKTSMVLFYAPWCQYCRAFESEYLKAGEMMKAQNSRLALARIDCTADGRNMCRKYHIDGYPTLKIFRSNHYSHDYSGRRKAEDIVEFMTTRYGPISHEIDSFEDITNLVYTHNEKTILFGCFQDPSSKMADVFFKFAKENQDKYHFVHTTNNDILQKCGESDGILLLYKPQLMKESRLTIHRFEGLSETDLCSFARYHTCCNSPDQENCIKTV